MRVSLLTCTYSGNSIQSMYDKQGDVASVVDFPGSITPKSVNYDQNGNETSEPHRYIATTYNLLNLPKQISWNGLNRKISNFYTFNGEKLRKTVEDNGTITKVDYCGPFVYETVSGLPSLKYIITPHGRAEKNGSSWVYKYNITDHLGNVRAEITPYIGGAPLVTQSRHYYTFGMEMSQLNSGSVVNKYQYNGKELQDDFGLYWYDYGARFYDPMLGRWHSVDPKAESMYGWTPYNYTLNNPINLIDPDGQLPGVPSDWAMAAAIWLSEKGGALKRLISGKSGEINAPTGYVPERTQQMSKSIGVAKDGTTVANGLVDIADGAATVLGNVPGAETGVDIAGATINLIEGDLEGALPYAEGLLLPISGKQIQIGERLFDAAKGGVTAYETALAGGKHSGFLKNYLGRNPDEINKAIKSMQSGNQGINIHLDKLATPSKYVPNWNTLRPGHQQSLINGWQNTVTKHTEQIQILKTILGN